jgi:adenylate cyclase
LASARDYSVIGDSVNLGARIESKTRDVDADILVSEATYYEIKNDFNCEFKGEVNVKGKSKPINIYSVLSEKIT